MHCTGAILHAFSWEASSAKHCVNRVGFMLTHANYLTVTASQGQTLRKGVTIDCARNEPNNKGRGTSDNEWWLNLYVMFSRVTKMEDMLLLRPPPRELLERGPPVSVREALRRFERADAETVADALHAAQELGITVPME